MPRVSLCGKGKGRRRGTLTTRNVTLAGDAVGQRASTTPGRGRPGKRSRGGKTVPTDAPAAKRTTCCTGTTTEESQLTALTEADIPRIVNAVKRGLSEFAVGSQVSDTLQTDKEEDFNPTESQLSHIGIIEEHSSATDQSATSNTTPPTSSHSKVLGAGLPPVLAKLVTKIES